MLIKQQQKVSDRQAEREEFEQKELEKKELDEGEEKGDNKSSEDV